ncbi:formate dehydrogenase subunit delta [Oceanicola sp. 22II-s10i]|uniref:formate dehydrogenase subunit delta n=1 Tax=Oceanicola sp. 22II-s10i TaxID=1317116 RepID=UPI000B526FAA|nr:formate dehydrogenase subunit delta [Oceanicola sp. 22II-s10i]
MSREKLVYMANQIATFFETQPGEGQAEKVVQHLSDFWEPRMREQLDQIVAEGGEGLKPLALEAAMLLRERA